MNTLDVSHFKTKIKKESWWEKLSPFFSTEECYKIYSYLKKRSKEDKITIFPNSMLTFEAFNYCEYKDVKLVILNQEPYSTMMGKKEISTGIAYDCSNTQKLQPSLEYLWYSIMNNFPGEVIKPEYDLKFLAEQGVLLINYSFTSEKNLLESHLKPNNVWESFIKFIFEDVFYGNSGIHYVLMGKYAAKAAKYINPLGNYIYKTEHPSYWSRMQDKDCNVDNIWKKINRQLSMDGMFPIEWNKDKWEKRNEISDELPF